MNQVKLYHQCGHNFIWNKDSFQKDHVGSGLILSPVNKSISDISGLPNTLKSVSFFDPQFYSPRSQHPKLATYNFFPNEIADEYSTTAYQEVSHDSALLCIDFQKVNDFKYYIIPAAAPSLHDTGYILKNDINLTQPFLTVLKKPEYRDTKKVLLTIFFSEQCKNEEYFDELLSYATSHMSIQGIYLIPSSAVQQSKRIKDSSYLLALLKFIDILKTNELEVHIGYTDIEGYLLTLAGVDSLPLGSFENLRHFKLDRFELKEKQTMMSPIPRIYSTELLQWIDYRSIPVILREYDINNALFETNIYRDEMNKPNFSGSSQNPAFYKHFFMVYSNQISSLPNTFDERFTLISNNIARASAHFASMKNMGIRLDSDTDGSHLAAWNDAVRDFNKYKRG